MDSMERSWAVKPRQKSQMSFLSINQDDIKATIDTKDSCRSKLVDSLKLILIALPPVVALAVISALIILQTNQRIRESEEMVQDLEVAETITHLVHVLQKERGMSCVFLSSDRNSSVESFNTLLQFRITTNDALVKWFQIKDGQHIQTKIEFKAAFEMHRADIMTQGIDCSTNLQWFNVQIDGLLQQLQLAFQQTDQGVLWNTIASYVALLKAKDLTGIQRAIGGSFFAAGTLDYNDSLSFGRVSGGAISLLETSWNEYPQSGKLMKSLIKKNHDLMEALGHMEQIVAANTFNYSDTSIGLNWFDGMTTYIGFLSEVENLTSKTLINQLQHSWNEASSQFYMTASIVAVSMVVCPLLMVWYGYKSQKLMKQIRKFTKSLSVKSEQLKQEKQRTEVVLNQMLPPSVVRSLKINQPVEPEHFDQVTLFFSGIKGFAALCGKCTPMQVRLDSCGGR